MKDTLGKSLMALIIGEHIIKEMKIRIEQLYKDKKISKKDYEYAIKDLQLAECKNFIDELEKLTIK